MGIISKKYRRVLVYFGIASVLFFTYYRFELNGRTTIDLGEQTTKERQAESWLRINNFDESQGKKKFIINVGTKRCFHIGTILQRCSTLNEMSSDNIPYTERKTIWKDLKGSYGYNWFGISEYVFYDILSLSSLGFLMSANEDMSFRAVSSISDQKSQTAYEWLNNVFVETTEPWHHLHEKEIMISDINVFFGEDCVDPRPGWSLDKTWLLYTGRYPSYLSYKYYDVLEKDLKDYRNLKVRENGKFKIVQLADLHFSVGKGECRDEYPLTNNCEADPKTLNFISRVLEIEQPDLVVFTGDQIMGDRSVQDSETSLFKALKPVIERKIPWAAIWGNHDHEGSLDRFKLSELTASLPYSLFSISPRDTNDNSFGVGNYILQINDEENQISTISLYFLDSHSYSQSGKIYPGYDWIKEEQWEYMKEMYDKSSWKQVSDQPHLSMAFFHIPIPEYLNFDSKKNPGKKNPIIGNFKEGITAPKYNSDGIWALDYLGINATTCGHDHCNDFCLLDDSSSRNIWLCFGGGSGEGGYAGYGGTERRIRVFEFDTRGNTIHTWKRLNGSPDERFDFQLISFDEDLNAA